VRFPRHGPRSDDASGLARPRRFRSRGTLLSRRPRSPAVGCPAPNPCCRDCRRADILSRACQHASLDTLRMRAGSAATWARRTAIHLNEIASARAWVITGSGRALPGSNGVSAPGSRGPETVGARSAGRMVGREAPTETNSGCSGGGVAPRGELGPRGRRNDRARVRESSRWRRLPPVPRLRPRDEMSKLSIRRSRRQCGWRMDGLARGRDRGFGRGLVMATAPSVECDRRRQRRRRVGELRTATSSR